MPPENLVISEIFGPTFQGEGPALGQRCGFVRLGRCPLNCAWCDTPYSWDWSRYDAASELTEMTPEQVVARLATMAIDTVVVTGGEPLLQQRRLVPLLKTFQRLRWSAHIETAGTIGWEQDARLIDQWVVSPKLANSGMTARRRLRYDVLAQFVTLGAAFKFVVVEPDDFEEIDHIARRAGIPPTSIWVMPEGTDARTVAKRTSSLAAGAVARGWNMTTRLHVLTWGNQRGR
jgi:7-cyano-7-deazaguanosine (preQ0) biosynthesis protein QueE